MRRVILAVTATVAGNSVSAQDSDTIVYPGLVVIKTVAVLNDPLVLLAAVEAGTGWTILPYYAVREGIRQGGLIELPLVRVADERYGIWWLRDRRFLEPSAQRLGRWLLAQEL